jgi:hypothetical protein
VNGRSDDVARRLAGELNDPLAEIGLDDGAARLFEGAVEAGFLGGHRLAFTTVRAPMRRATSAM